MFQRDSIGICSDASAGMYQQELIHFSGVLSEASEESRSFGKNQEPGEALRSFGKNWNPAEAFQRDSIGIRSDASAGMYQQELIHFSRVLSEASERREASERTKIQVKH